MFTELRLKNFKSWEDTGEIRMAPITAFFGANSSGKTSLLQALLLMKQTVESSDRNSVLQFGTQDSLVNLGNFKSVITGHEIDRTLSMEVSFESVLELWEDSGSGISTSVQRSKIVKFATQIGFETGKLDLFPRVYTEEFSYNVDDELAGMRIKDDSSNEYVLLMDAEPQVEPNSPTDSIHNVLYPNSTPIKFYGFPGFANGKYFVNRVTFEAEAKFVEKFNRLRYVGPVREYPRRSYEYSDGRPDSLGHYGELFLDAIIASRSKNEKFKSDEGEEYNLEGYVAYWLKRIGLIETFEVRELGSASQIYQVFVKKNAHSPEALITDVGFGVSQILPVIVLCFYAPVGATIILEQPELHLHPSVQESLADVLIDAVQKRKVQIILESHSEHLLRRLQRRIAEEKLGSEDIALYFCKNVGATSSLTPLEIDPLGNIKNWPEDFFGDQFGELAETQRARIDRMKKSRK